MLIEKLVFDFRFGQMRETEATDEEAEDRQENRFIPDAVHQSVGQLPRSVTYNTILYYKIKALLK